VRLSKRGHRYLPLIVAKIGRKSNPQKFAEYRAKTGAIVKQFRAN
jgi:hypothetical protein